MPMFRIVMTIRLFLCAGPVKRRFVMTTLAQYCHDRTPFSPGWASYCCIFRRACYSKCSQSEIRQDNFFSGVFVCLCILGIFNQVLVGWLSFEKVYIIFFHFNELNLNLQNAISQGHNVQCLQPFLSHSSSATKHSSSVHSRVHAFCGTKDENVNS